VHALNLGKGHPQRPVANTMFGDGHYKSYWLLVCQWAGTQMFMTGIFFFDVSEQQPARGFLSTFFSFSRSLPGILATSSGGSTRSGAVEEQIFP
jgi:hypothetical protein